MAIWDKWTSWALTLMIIGTAAGQADLEVFEIGLQNREELPGGKEADGILGDFVMRNSLVEILISNGDPTRKADMGTFWNGTTPGCLYDLTLRGADNDQLTIFSPSGQKGAVSSVRIVDTDSDERIAVETFTAAERNIGLETRHQYILEEGWQGLLIITSHRNEGDKPRKVTTSDIWKPLSRTVRIQDIMTGDAVDPADRAGYAYTWLEYEGMQKPAPVVELQPGESITYARGLTVGTSPAQAWGLLASLIAGSAGQLDATIQDASGNAVSGSQLNLSIDGKELIAYADDAGKLNLTLPAGEYQGTLRCMGRDDLEVSFAIGFNNANPTWALAPQAGIHFKVTDINGSDIPCKIQVLGRNATPSPDFGPANRAHGCKDQYHSEVGEFFLPTPSGEYRVVVTRGIEHGSFSRDVKLCQGEQIELPVTLIRQVDSSGWISADYHNHSTPSGDNNCGTDDRIINLAAEHIEFAPTTEHNRLYDWTPHIEKLGLKEEIITVPGIELTGSGAHFNSFPFKPVPYLQDGGAPQWNRDPRLTALTLRGFQGEDPQRWLHLNHPDMVADFIDRNGDGSWDGGFQGLENMIDAAETWGLGILSSSPFSIVKNGAGQESVKYSREFIWLQMLNQGHRYWCIAAADAHSVHGNGVGGWRIYVPSSTDEPEDIDWVEITQQSKAGRIIVTNGPFLEVSSHDGVLPGGLARAQDVAKLDVKVQCANWIAIDRVQVLVNGRAKPEYNFTRKSHPEWFKEGTVVFDRQIDVKVSQDSHIIVVAYGENSDLSIGYGTSSQSSMNPCAYNNPIFFDVDGGGFQPNHDNLGFDLPTKGLSVDDAKAILGAKSL